VPGDDCDSTDNVDQSSQLICIWRCRIGTLHHEVYRVEVSMALVGRSKMSRELLSRNRCYTICERIGDVIP